MSSEIEDQVVKTSKIQWKPLVEMGFHYNGIYVKSLRYDETRKRSPSIVLKFEAGSSYPYHNHPAGEELFVLKGSCLVNEAYLEAGDYRQIRRFRCGVWRGSLGRGLIIRL